MAPALGKYEDNIDQRTRWWSSYPATGYIERTKANETLDSYLSDVFLQPKTLARTASATNLTYYHHAGDRTEAPIRKCPSFSSLSPSHALPYDLRVPTRYLPKYQVHKTEMSKWYTGAYAPSQYKETRGYAAKLEHDTPHDKLIYGRTWYYPGMIDNLASHGYPNESYVRGSMRHMNRSVSDRLRYDDAYMNYIHNSYDRRVDNCYLRYMSGQPGTFVGRSIGLPRSMPAIHQYRMFRLNNRVIY